MIEKIRIKYELLKHWFTVKFRLHNVKRYPHINDGEIYWCAMGENIGVEINGKSKSFSRPVVVVRKLSELGFIGVPLTSQPHDGSWYIKFNSQNKERIAVVTQVRTFSTLRLYDRIGEVDEEDLRRIRAALCNLIGE